MGAPATTRALARSLTSAPCSSTSSSNTPRVSRLSSPIRVLLPLTSLPLLLLGLMLGESDALPQHQQRFLSDSYAKQVRADPDAEFHLAIGLHVRDFDALERKLWHVSDPRYVTCFLSHCVCVH